MTVPESIRHEPAVPTAQLDIVSGSCCPPVMGAAAKPRFRGRMHAGAAVASLFTGAVLVATAFATARWQAGVAVTVYAVAVLALFATSASYHRLTWSTRGDGVMKRLDHSMIFVLIAGSYTPLAVLALPHHTAVVVLWIVWTGAALGVGIKTAWPHAPSYVGVPLYIALGWVAAFVFPQLLQGGGVTALTLIAAGGLAYTSGGIAYALKRPDPYPATFGFHEVFHACTVMAAVCHYVAIWFLLF